MVPVTEKETNGTHVFRSPRRGAPTLPRIASCLSLLLEPGNVFWVLGVVCVCVCDDGERWRAPLLGKSVVYG